MTITDTTFPQGLTGPARWGVWSKVTREGAPTKMPMQVSGQMASSTDPKTWADYSDAHAALYDGADGLAFFIHGGDWCFVDFDHLSDHFADRESLIDILRDLGGYQEISQSGDGIHVLLKLCPGEAQKPHRCRHDRGIEVYTKSRFVALTGNTEPLSNYSTDIDSKEWTLEEIGRVLDIALMPKTGEKGNNNTTSTKSSITDERILSRVLRKSNFKMLHDGVFDEGRHSEAVMAWLCHIVYYTQDKDQVDRLFKQSGLYTGKWAEGKWDRLHADTTPNGQWARAMAYLDGKTATWEDCLGKLDGGAMDEGGGSESRPDHNDYIGIVRELYQPRLIIKDVMTAEVCFLTDRGPHGTPAWLHLTDTNVVKSVRAYINRIPKDLRNGLSAANVENEFGYYSSLVAEWGYQVGFADWDGVDRLAQMADCLAPADPRLIPEAVRYFVKDWAVRMVGRCFNHRIPNRMMLFQGEQGIGKDTWARTLCGGLDEYYIEPSLPQGKNLSEQDFVRAIRGALVANFDEFDKTEGAEHILKSVLTKQKFSVDIKYEKVPQKTYHRTSYIGSCNVSSILRDATGNRRYLVLKLKGGPGEAIRWLYPCDFESLETTDYSRQLIAQAHYEFRANGGAPIPPSREFEAIMEDIQREETPSSVERDVLDVWREKVLEWCDLRGYEFYCFSGIPEAQSLLDAVADELDISGDRGAPKHRKVYALLVAAGAAGGRRKMWVPSIKKGVRWISLPEWFQNSEYMRRADSSDPRRFHREDAHASSGPTIFDF